MAPRLKTDELLARLRPWLPTLQKLQPPSHTVASELPIDNVGPRVVWINGGSTLSGDSARVSFESVCEALSLLTLLARVDVVVWKRVVRAVWVNDTRLDEWLETSMPTEFVVGLQMDSHSSRDSDQFRRLKSHYNSDSQPSEDYVRVYAYLEAAQAGRRSQCDEADTTVRLCIELGERKTTPDVLYPVIGVVSAEAWARHAREATTRIGSQRGHRPVFKITHVDLPTSNEVTLNSDGLHCVEQLVQLGVRVSHLPILEVHQTPAIGQALREIGGLNRSSDTQKPGVQSITIEDQTSSALIPALLMMAQHSAFIQRIDMNVASEADAYIDDETDLWRWIAYALFSRHADHKIETLVLNLDMLNNEQVAAVRGVLESSSPYAVPMGVDMEDFPQIPPMTPRQVVASRFVLDCGVDKPKLPFETKNPIAVRVVQPPHADSPGRWAVSLPGYGNAFVYAEDVLSTSQEDLPLVNRKTAALPGFRRIDIVKMSDGSMDSVVDLLELVGHETQRLDFYEHTGEADVGDWCGQVLTACPKLQELLVRHGYVENLEVFVKAADAGHCRLRELVLVMVPTGRHAKHFGVFFKALSDPTHPLAHHLRDLELRLIVDTENPSYIVEPVLKMLRQNRRLVSFHLNVTPADTLEAPLSAFYSAFAKFNDKAVFVRTGPLGVREKLAFLSIVTGDSGDLKSVVRQFDTNLMEIVFQFAAVGRERKVRFSYGMMATDEPDEDDDGSDAGDWMPW